MKKIFIQILWVMAIILVAIPSYSQSQGQKERLSPEQIQKIKGRVAERVAQFGDYIQQIAYKYDMTNEEQMEFKKFLRQRALDLFIGCGKGYDEIIETTQGVDTVHREGVMMEVTSLNRSTTSRRLVRKYLTGLMNLSYDQVEIKTTEWHKMRVTDLKKITDNRFICTCYIEQEFRGYRKDGSSYRDKTRKLINCEVKLLETEEGLEYQISLGDVKALETTRL